MPDAGLVKWIRGKFVDLADELDERGRRRWAAIEAKSLGHGGIAAVAEATAISDRTIRTAIKELESRSDLPQDRQRRAGAGRRSRKYEPPLLAVTVERMIALTTGGEPTNPLRWTCKSTYTLAAELRSQGFEVGPSTVRELLAELGYSLQGNRKAREGKQHPERNTQVEHINARVKVRKRRGEPALSVDTKQKEKLGNMSNAGKTYEPKGQHRKTDTHNFPDQEKGKAVPNGVYDIHRNQAFVSVGISHDTAQFAVAAIRLWWKVSFRQPCKFFRGAARLGGKWGRTAPRGAGSVAHARRIVQRRDHNAATPSRHGTATVRRQGGAIGPTRGQRAGET